MKLSDAQNKVMERLRAGALLFVGEFIVLQHPDKSDAPTYAHPNTIVCLREMGLISRRDKEMFYTLTDLGKSIEL